VPKCFGVAVVILLGGAWMLQTTITFTDDLFARLPELLS
jgi:flagellar biosynthesis protein FliQ